MIARLMEWFRYRKTLRSLRRGIRDFHEGRVLMWDEMFKGLSNTTSTGTYYQVSEETEARLREGER
jgi:hypothetical protein